MKSSLAGPLLQVLDPPLDKGETKRVRERHKMLAGLIAQAVSLETEARVPETCCVFSRLFQPKTFCSVQCSGELGFASRILQRKSNLVHLNAVVQACQFTLSN